jgi:WD40 repeat protein
VPRREEITPMPLKLLKSLDADDIFISYSRTDGSAYLTGLDAALSKHGFSCFTDKRGTDAGRLPPKTLFRKISLCKTLVLLASPGARERPDNITPELEKFAENNGTSRIICVSFDGGGAFEDFPGAWEPFVVGKAREREDPGALKTGTPSEAVVAAVVAASDYMKSKDRLLKYRNRAVAVLGALVVAIAAAAVIAGIMFKRAAAETLKAQEATARADEATAKANAEQALAAQKTREAQEAQTEAAGSSLSAGIQKLSAQLASDEAAEQTRLAGEAARAAREASARAKAEQAKAVRQQSIAAARSDANRAQTLMRQRPEEASRSLKVAVDSMDKSVSARFHSLEADTALRESLALTPRLHQSRAFASGQEAHDVKVFALSPDGGSFAWLSDGKLHVGATGGGEPAVCEYDGEALALSNGAARVAAVNDEGVVETIDMKTCEAGALAPPALFNNPDKIALSPGGRYLAYASGHGKGSANVVSVVDTRSGNVIKTFEQYAAAPKDKNEGARGALDRLGVEVSDLAFGPTGDLALGGSVAARAGQALAGQVIIWRLRLYPEGFDPERPPAERALAEGDFARYETIPQREAVLAVAPGLDDTYFATDKGVWKRRPGRPDFEPVARLGYRMKWPTQSHVQKLAFHPDGKRLTIIKSVEAPRTWESKDEKRLETWDASGYQNPWQAFTAEAVTGVGFAPAGQFVAVMTGEGASDGPVAVYNTADGTKAGPLNYAAEAVGRPARNLSPAADFLIQADSETAVVWNVWEGVKTEVALDTTLKEVEMAAISPGGRFFALSGKNAAGMKTVVVYDRRADNKYRMLKVIPQDEIRKEKDIDDEVENEEFDIVSLSLSADGPRLAVLYDYADEDRFVRVWDLAGRGNISPPCMKASPEDKNKNGCEVIVNADGVWLSPDGRFVMVKDNSNLGAVLDLSKGEAAKFELLLEDTVVTSAAFSPDSRYLAVGTEEGVVHVFESERPDDEVALLRHDGRVSAVAFSEGGRYVATASHAEGTQTFPVRVWPLQPDELLGHAWARLGDLCREKVSEASGITCPRASLAGPRRGPRRAQ